MQHWTKLDYPEGEPCPEGRQGHAAVCLSPGARPQLVVFGGADTGGDTLIQGVMWILDVESRRWKEVRTVL